ncbi:pathogenicity island 2 effector protein SseG [Salmonella enterica]|uniref:Pathogenicity island 2 effector protein SseG n=1 Tax=Salmonella diarizonae TaxID=59204 RepID=A0A702GFN7_SALDZ|nr:pathogenicity island 2 effector protein SseG [Salmonella enterica subsp. diarizonae]EGD1493587.1 pathogenicity island 2 effector protein SseG [Salmonella enterica]EHG3717227.1 pathogenicity island 2 effector protein SseG [Salmonella enterica subsp. diarizonae serovar 11:k:z53]EKR1692322.1 pathogenicity island 2 effector protein SseG [Salmonella enterica subsp. diarizonae serovar 6,7,14:k:z50]EHM6601191.1 pathogenicity island 2 effector protein SseG [Salmonella enterica]
MKPVSPNAQVGGQLPVYAPTDSSPCPSLPHPETTRDVEIGRIDPQQGKERLLTGLAKRMIAVFPKEIFSWQMVILGGQVLCCSAGIALTVLSGGGAPLLAMAGVGLAIAIADVACLIYHHKHHLPVAHDSIGNAVFYIANCFVNQRKSMAIAKAVSLGGRLALTATVMTHSYWSSTLGLQSHLLERINDITYGLMSFTRFGMDGMAMTGMQVSSPLYRLLAQVMPEQSAPE